MPKLSVIIPVYNVEKYIDKCIGSVLAQTLRDIEVILVDDQSPDNCPQKCDEYSNLDNRVKVIHKKNGGLGMARNSGLDIASGEYITFLDSDDYVDLDAYEKVCRIADEHKLDSLRFQCNHFNNAGVSSPICKDLTLSVCGDQEQIKRYSLEIFDLSNKTDGNPVGGSCCMAVFRLDIIKKQNLRFVSEREYVSEDYIFAFTFNQYAKRIGAIPYTYYHYRVNQESLTHSLRKDRVEACARYAEYVEKLISSFGYSNADHHYAQAYFVGNVRSACRLIFMSSMRLSEKRKWFDEHIRGGYLSKVRKNFNGSLLPLKQRICWWTISRQLFFPTYLIIVLFTKLRRKGNY